jgi:hypothetical protein
VAETRTKGRGSSRGSRKSARKKSRAPKGRKQASSGKLRIGDQWNAITIIALSQNNPLKAIAEFVENSIDARARNITIVRGRERGELYLKVIDDGEGIPLNEEGLPNFRYVATHICDSLKKRLKEGGAEGIQGEFGIGLLSFWTVGERLLLSSAGDDGKTYQMEMNKGESGYSINQKRSLFSHPGTELTVHPLLPGIRQLNGERIQHYLASELRDRIRRSGVQISIKDRYSRKALEVKPREYSGRLLHELQVVESERGEIYLELYLNPRDVANTVSLFRSGTRVLPAVNRLDLFDREPWTSGYLQGSIDVPFLQLTPAAEQIARRAEQRWEEADSREFYEYPGPLHKAIVSPASCVVGVGGEKALRCVARDKKGRTVEEALEFDWSIIEGEGALVGRQREIVTFTAPQEPGLVIVACSVRQGEVNCRGQSTITVTESLVEQEEVPGKEPGKGLPGYTYLRAPGELWRSRYEEKKNLVVINNAHADYLFASQKPARKLKYICRLFAKELVLNNFRGFDSGELLERMIELSLYTEEHLR